MRFVRTLCLAVLVGASAGSARAADAPTPAQTKEARTHFRAGTVFYEAANYDRAIEEYLAAYKILPLPDMLFNLAQAYRLKGELRLAVEYYKRFLAERPNAPMSAEARQTLLVLEVEVSKLPPPEAKPNTKPIAEPAPPVAPPAPNPIVTATASPSPSKPKPKRRWVWGVVGASIAVGVAVGVGLGIGLGAKPRSPDESLGSITPVKQ